MNTQPDGVSAMSAELDGDDDGDLQTRYDMLKSWLVEADASNDRLKKHLSDTLEIAHTWQPIYATKLDRDTLALAAQAIGYEPPNAETAASTDDEIINGLMGATISETVRADQLHALAMDYAVLCGELSKGLAPLDEEWLQLRDLGERLDALSNTSSTTPPVA